MSGNGEIIERSVNDFLKVQKRMLLAKEENAMKTYEDLKDDYISLRVILVSMGVNLTEIDRIKE